MPWWGWIVLGTVILISEIIVSTDFYLVFFAASAVIVGLLVLLGVSLPVSAQWLIFAALSIGMLVLFRARLREKIKTREQDVDKLEDEIAVATEQLAVGATDRLNCGARPGAPGISARWISRLEIDAEWNESTV